MSAVASVPALAWLGVSLLMLTEAPLGLALGLLLVSIGLGVGELIIGQPTGAIALFLSGGLAAALQFTRGERGWRLARNFTPRVVFSLLVLIVVLLLASIFHLAVPIWMAAVMVVVSAGARLVEADKRRVAGAASTALLWGLSLMAAPGEVIIAAIGAIGLVLLFGSER